MPRNVPQKESGIPGVTVATYSTPTCNNHLAAEQSADDCPYCIIAELLDRGLVPPVRARAKAALIARRRR